MLLLIISSAAVVRRRRRLLRIFQMGRTRGPRDSRDSRAHRAGFVPARRVALNLKLLHLNELCGSWMDEE